MANLAQMGDVQNARMVLSKILEETGTFSPMELAVMATQPTGTPSPIQPEDLQTQEATNDTTTGVT
jgi:hypothetical protein